MLGEIQGNLIAVLVALFVSFIAGTLAGSEYVRFLIYGKIIWKGLLRKPLLSARPVCCKVYTCKDGLVVINGLKIENKIPFIYLPDCWVKLSKAFGEWVLHWQAHYDKRLSRVFPSGRWEHYDGSVNELCDEYARRLDEYARYPKSMIALPKRSGRIIEILAEIHKFEESHQKSLHEIVESEKGEYHLMISEPDLKGNPHLTPVTIEEGWNGNIVAMSDMFGWLETIKVEIPKSPEIYIDWHTGLEIPEEERKNRGYPLRLKIVD